MLIKPGVKIVGIKVETLLAIQVAQSIYIEAGFELVVNSLLDGTHMQNSLHYKGLAVDLRVPSKCRRLKPTSLLDWEAKNAIKQALGSSYNVILELEDHIHIEFDPK